MAAFDVAPHFPQQVPIDAYGKGGFAFAGMSHRGSLLCLPTGLWAWPVASAAELDAASFEPVLAAALPAPTGAAPAGAATAGTIELFLLGSGRDPWFMPPPLRARLEAAGFAVDVMTTGAAVRTYNILLGERRRVAAGLIAVE